MLDPSPELRMTWGRCRKDCPFLGSIAEEPAAVAAPFKDRPFF